MPVTGYGMWSSIVRWLPLIFLDTLITNIYVEMQPYLVVKILNDTDAVDWLEELEWWFEKY